MATRILIPTSTRRKFKSRNIQSKTSNRPSFSKDPLFSHISNYELPSPISFSRSPIQNTSKHSNSIFTTKEFPSSTPRVIKKSMKIPNKRRNSCKRSPCKSPSKPKILSKLSQRKENLRYLKDSLESSKCFNGVSTPPEETFVHQRTLSPFSDIMDEQLSRYINFSFSGINRLELPKRSLGCVDDSYQYSTAESRKKNFKVCLEKKRKTVQPSKTPPPFSIFAKIKPENFKRLSNKKYK